MALVFTVVPFKTWFAVIKDQADPNAAAAQQPQRSKCYICGDDRDELRHIANFLNSVPAVAEAFERTHSGTVWL